MVKDIAGGSVDTLVLRQVVWVASFLRLKNVFTKSARMQVFRRLSALVDELQKLPRVLSDLTSALQSKSTSAKNEDKIPRRSMWAAWTNAGASWAAVVAASVYALITHCQFNEMKKQTDASFNGQAGWLEVLVSDIQISDPELLSGDRLAFSYLLIRDRGLTPLTRVSGELVIRTFARNQIPTFTYNGPKTCEEIGIIYPDRSKSDDPVLAAANNPPTPVPLNEDQYLPGQTQIPDCREATVVALLPSKQISPSEYQRLLDGQEIIVAYGKVRYFDVFKRQHWAYMCRVLPPSKTIAPNIDVAMLSPDVINIKRVCLKYNDIINPT
jgi:hypothetical protein